MQPPFLTPAMPKPRIWSRTPPALFTPIFGLFGLGIAWRRAVDAWAAPFAVSEVVFGAVSLLYLFVLAAYLTKVARRPGVVVEDLRVLPGRAGLAAMSMSAMLMAAGLIPLSEALAAAVLVVALIVHALLLALVVRGLITGRAESRSVTPVWHLTFVGFIIAPIAAVPLGWTTLSTVILWVTLAMAVIIWGASAVQFARRDVPAPLRPLLAIHVAPASVLGSVALLLGHDMLAFGLGLFAAAMVALLVARVLWLTEAGFSPLWGAFTFPAAAFAALMLLLGAAGMGEAFRYLGALVLVLASMGSPVVMWKVIQLWAKGMLAVKTNAAQA